MANRILKGLAVAAGTGLAMGFTSGRARVRTVRYHPPLPASETIPAAPPTSNQAPFAGDRDDEFLDIEPLLDRLERVEARVESMGERPVSAALGDFAAAIADLERRVEENTRELALLRESIAEAESRVTRSVVAVQTSFDQTRADL